MKKNIKLATFDCWDTIIKNNGNYDMIINESIVESINSIWKINKSLIIKALETEEKNFSFLLNKKLITLPSFERIKYLLKYLGLIASNIQINEIDSEIQNQIFKPIPELIEQTEYLLSRLHSKCKIALICNTGWFSGNGIKKVFDYYKLSKYFDLMTFSDEVHSAKPKPDIFYTVLNHFNVKATDMLHIGDKKSTDYKGSKNINCEFIHYSGVTSLNMDIPSISSFVELYNFILNRYNLVN